VLCVAALVTVSAHDLGQSESRLEIDGSIVRATTIIDLLEFPKVDDDGNGRITIAELDRAIGDVFARVKAHLVMTGDDQAPRQVTLDRHELADDHVLRMTIVYEFPHAVSRLAVTSTLDQLSRPDHQHLVSAVIAGDRRQAVLDASNRSVSINVAASRVTWPRVLAVLGAIGLIGVRFVWIRRRTIRHGRV